jgi:hypothetical protein
MRWKPRTRRSKGIRGWVSRVSGSSQSITTAIRTPRKKLIAAGAASGSLSRISGPQSSRRDPFSGKQRRLLKYSLRCSLLFVRRIAMFA